MYYTEISNNLQSSVSPNVREICQYDTWLQVQNIYSNPKPGERVTPARSRGLLGGVSNLLTNVLGAL